MSLPSGWTTIRRPGPRRSAARAGEGSAVAILFSELEEKTSSFFFFEFWFGGSVERALALFSSLISFSCSTSAFPFRHQTLLLCRHGLHVEGFYRIDCRRACRAHQHGPPRPRLRGRYADADVAVEDRLWLLPARPPRGRCLGPLLLLLLFGGTSRLFRLYAVSDCWLSFTSSDCRIPREAALVFFFFTLLVVILLVLRAWRAADSSRHSLLLFLPQKDRRRRVFATDVTQL